MRRGAADARAHGGAGDARRAWRGGTRGSTRPRLRPRSARTTCEESADRTRARRARAIRSWLGAHAVRVDELLASDLLLGVATLLQTAAMPTLLERLALGAFGGALLLQSARFDFWEILDFDLEPDVAGGIAHLLGERFVLAHELDVALAEC